MCRLGKCRVSRHSVAPFAILFSPPFFFPLAATLTALRYSVAFEAEQTTVRHAA